MDRISGNYKKLKTITGLPDCTHAEGSTGSVIRIKVRDCRKALASHPSSLGRVVQNLQVTARDSVCIIGHYHGGNLGDDYVVRLIIENMRSRRPDLAIYGVSQGPVDTAQRHGIPAFPLRRDSIRAPGRRQEIRGALHTSLKKSQVLRWLVQQGRRILIRPRMVLHEVRFLWRSYRVLEEQRTRLVLVAGSGPLSDDWAGPWGHPYTIFKWAVLSRLAHAHFALLSIGAGPLDSRLGRFFVAWTLRLASYCSFRDPSSFRVARTCWIKVPELVVPDLAFSQPIEAPAPNPRTSNRRVVGVNAMAYCDPRSLGARGDQRRHGAYVRKLAELCIKLLDCGHEVRILYSGMNSDPLACEDLVRAVSEGSSPSYAQRFCSETIHGFQSLLEAMQRCDVVVAARFHCIIFSHLLEIPALALAYHPKTWDLMTYQQQSHYCLDIDGFEVTTALSLVEELCARSQEQRAIISNRSNQHVDRLDRQYKEVISRLLGDDERSTVSAV